MWYPTCSPLAPLVVVLGFRYNARDGTKRYVYVFAFIQTHIYIYIYVYIYVYIYIFGKTVIYLWALRFIWAGAIDYIMHSAIF